MQHLLSRRVLAFLVLGSLAVLAVTGCGRESMVGRRVDDFSAYYNTFYNALDAFNEGIRPLGELEEPVDPDAYLPVFVEPAKARNEEAFTKTIEKSADLLRQHPGSKWVDDALLLIGKAYYYQENYVGAEQKFREVISQDGSLTGEARFWLGRTFLSSGDLNAADGHLRASLEADSLSDRWVPSMKLTQGDLFVRQGAWEEAAAALEEGLRGVRDGQVRARAFFLRGQALEAAGRHAAAARSFRSAYGERPRYELAYAAQVAALRMAARTEEQGAPVLRALRRMERDDKNEAKLAELILLRGQFYQVQGQPRQARARYRELLYPGSDGPAALAPSAVVRGRAHYALAMLYRDTFGDYTRAAAHFDTAATTLPEAAPAEGAGAARPTAYAITDSRRQAERYGRVAEASGTITRLDSLLRLGEMDEERFRTFVDSVARARAEAAREEEERARRLEAERRFTRGGGGASSGRGRSGQAGRGTTSSLAGGVNRPRTGVGGGTAGGSAGAESGFLFHRDARQVQEGLRGFLRLWGERPRVPNWRRRAAISAQAGQTAPGETSGQVGLQDELSTAGLPEVDVSEVPRLPERQRATRAERAAARYDLGNALLLAAGRPDSAAVWFRRVIEEGPDTAAVVQRARYALAEAERAAGRPDEARLLYRRVVRDQPGTELARRAEQRLAEERGSVAPSRRERRAEDEYAQAYRAWQDGARETALGQMLAVAAAHPEAPVAPRALLAAARTGVEWTRRAGRPLTAPLPARPPASLHALLTDSTAGAAAPAPPDTSAAASSPDSTAAPDSTEVSSLTPAAFTVSSLLNGLVERYPQTIHADRARRMLTALREETAPPEAASPSPDSTAVPDSSEAESPGPRRRLNVSAGPPGQAGAAADSAAAGDAPGRGWTIAIGAAQGEEEAARKAERFEEKFGQAAWVVSPTRGGEPLREDDGEQGGRYTVALGRFESRAEAETALRRQAAMFPAESRVMRLPRAPAGRN